MKRLCLALMASQTALARENASENFWANPLGESTFPGVKKVDQLGGGGGVTPG